MALATVCPAKAPAVNAATAASMVDMVMLFFISSIEFILSFLG